MSWVSTWCGSRLWGRLEAGGYLHGGRRLLAQLEQLLVALLDLLVERLVLDLELLEVDEVQACDHVQLQDGLQAGLQYGVAGWGCRLGRQAGVAAARARGAPSASFSF